MAQHPVYLTVNPKQQETEYLAIIKFYYLFISRQYTKPQRVKRNGKLVRATRSKHFRVKDVGFWKDGKIISRHESINTLLEADSTTQKYQIRKAEEWGKLTPRINRNPGRHVSLITQGTPHPDQ